MHLEKQLQRKARKIYMFFFQSSRKEFVSVQKLPHQNQFQWQQYPTRRFLRNVVELGGYCLAAIGSKG